MKVIEYMIMKVVLVCIVRLLRLSDKFLIDKLCVCVLNIDIIEPLSYVLIVFCILYIIFTKL